MTIIVGVPTAATITGGRYCLLKHFYLLNASQRKAPLPLPTSSLYNFLHLYFGALSFSRVPFSPDKTQGLKGPIQLKSNACSRTESTLGVPLHVFLFLKAVSAPLCLFLLFFNLSLSSPSHCTQPSVSPLHLFVLFCLCHVYTCIDICVCICRCASSPTTVKIQKPALVTFDGAESPLSHTIEV